MINHLKLYQNQHVVSRYAKEENISLDTALKHFEECKKFLFLCSISEIPLSPSERIDKIWHEFIMFTKDYNNFCIEVLGAFIHHVPDTVHDEATRKNNKKSFEYARTLAIATFEEIDPYMWCFDSSEIEAADCTSCISCRSESTLQVQSQ
jgi:hypothetical protein